MIFNRIPFPATGGFDPLRDIAYTGAFTAEEKTMDGVDYWLMIFSGTGMLTVNKDGLTGDICVCGGGSGGQSASSRDTGNGGNGGFVNNYSAQAVASGEIVIGAGGGAGAAGGATSYGNLSANGGLAPTNTYTITVSGGSSGGTGNRNTSQYRTGQGTTTRPFGSEEMEPLGAGGGGGAYHDEYLDRYYAGGAGSTDGGTGNVAYASGSMYSAQPGGAGGNKGGGKGGSCSNSGVSAAGAAGSYYGAGGGGGAQFIDGDNGFVNSAGGAGYPGVVMIRIAK